MRDGTIYVVGMAALLAVLSGWLVPAIFRSRRPFGLFGDVVVCTVATVALAFVEWMWILPALGFGTGWIALAAAIGDPLGLGWVCLWLMRKVKG